MQIGVIAGAGLLPLIITQELKKRGYRVITVALQGLANNELSNYSDVFELINIGKVGKIIDFLKNNNIKEIILTGKVPKEIIFERDKIKPDMRALKMLFSAKIRGDNELLKIVEKELLTEGIRIIEIFKVFPEFITPNGVLTIKKPTKEEWKDIEYGFKIAKKIGELDIGQTVVVKEMSVVAVEAIEGTDETILRAGRFVKNTIVVKVSKPQQDLRLDPPAAGVDTIVTMGKANAKILALEAGKTLLIQQDEMIKKANENNIIVVGIKQP